MKFHAYTFIESNNIQTFTGLLVEIFFHNFIMSAVSFTPDKNSKKEIFYGLWHQDGT